MNDMKRRGAWSGALAISTVLAACGGGDDNSTAADTARSGSDAAQLHATGGDGDPGGLDRPADERRRRDRRSR